jgi:thymidylate synthase (FAD)
MGSDLTVVNAARVSFNKESWWANEEDWLEFDSDLRLEDKDEKLIKYLAREGHWTPFGHGQITLRESVPIFVARQRFKHTVGFIYNEVSRRYVDSDPEFFTPTTWRGKAKDRKQGSSDEVVDDQGMLNRLYDDLIERAQFTYNWYIKAGVAPEQARMVLPQSMYTEYYVTGSLAAWARAYNLRSDSHAQQEIQELATHWQEIIQPLFPVSWAALTFKGNENA